MWWETDAYRPVARQKVLFSSPPQASSGRLSSHGRATAEACRAAAGRGSGCPGRPRRPRAHRPAGGAGPPAASGWPGRPPRPRRPGRAWWRRPGWRPGPRTAGTHPLHDPFHADPGPHVTAPITEGATVPPWLWRESRRVLWRGSWSTGEVGFVIEPTRTGPPARPEGSERRRPPGS